MSIGYIPKKRKHIKRIRRLRKKYARSKTTLLVEGNVKHYSKTNIETSKTSTISKLWLQMKKIFKPI